MKRIALALACAFALLFGGLAHTSYAQKSSTRPQGAQSVRQVRQPFNRKLTPSQPTDITSSFEKKGNSTGSTTNSIVTNGLPAPMTSFNDPGYKKDPTNWDLIAMPQAVNELARIMAQHGDTAWKEVAIAILDSGGLSHPDLDAARMFEQDVDLVGGVITDTHGTDVESLLIAMPNNGMGSLGIAGYTGRVKIFHVRMFDNDGNTSLQQELDGISAIIAKKNAGVPIVAVNCSFGGTGEILLERQAFEALSAAGIASIAAAGVTTPGMGCDFYPACYSETNHRVIAVGGLAGSDLAKSSGTEGQIGAPVNMLVVNNPLNPDSVAAFGAVSSATPQVAGTLALLLSMHPDMSVDQAIAQVKATCNRSIGGTTYGLVNVFMAITQAPLLVSKDGSVTDAVAFDAADLTTGPFHSHKQYFLSIHGEPQVPVPTSVMLFALNMGGATPSQVTITVTDQGGRTYNPPTEYVGAVPFSPFLYQFTFSLGELPSGSLRVHALYNGSITNDVSFAVQQ